MGDWGNLIHALQRLGLARIAAFVIVFYAVSLALSMWIPEPREVWGIPSQWLGGGLSAALAWLLVWLGDFACRGLSGVWRAKAQRAAEGAALMREFSFDEIERAVFRRLFIEPGVQSVDLDLLRTLDDELEGAFDASLRLRERKFLVYCEFQRKLTIRDRVFKILSANPALVGSAAPPRSMAL